MSRREQTQKGIAGEPRAQAFLRWAGSKRRLLQQLMPFWSNEYRRYVEPFAGSACLFFALGPPRAWLSDINQELILTYIAVRDCPKQVSEALSAMKLGKQRYNLLRRMDPRALSQEERAARFIFLNRFCFNGLYRTNLMGQFNVPYSPAKTGLLPSAVALKEASAALLCADIGCADFEDVLDETCRGDFVYLDPPYARSTTRSFREYAPNSFALDDIPRLSNAIARLDERGVSFVLSYASCPEALEAFSGWPMETHRVQRNIAGFAKHRRQALALLVTNCPSTHSQRTLEDNN